MEVSKEVESKSLVGVSKKVESKSLVGVTAVSNCLLDLFHRRTAAPTWGKKRRFFCQISISVLPDLFDILFNIYWARHTSCPTLKA